MANESVCVYCLKPTCHRYSLQLILNRSKKLGWICCYFFLFLLLIKKIGCVINRKKKYSLWFISPQFLFLIIDAPFWARLTTLDSETWYDRDANTLYTHSCFCISIQGQKLDLQNLYTGKITPRCRLAFTSKQQGNKTCSRKKGPSI